MKSVSAAYAVIKAFVICLSIYTEQSAVNQSLQTQRQRRSGHLREELLRGNSKRLAPLRGGS